jgi:hypothetical protein
MLDFLGCRTLTLAKELAARRNSMTRARTIITLIFFSLSVLALSPANLPAQAFTGSTYKANAAILSAGSRAAAISRLKVVPSVGVVNLNIRYVNFHVTFPRAHDVAAFKISLQKHQRNQATARRPCRNPAARLVSP